MMHSRIAIESLRIETARPMLPWVVISDSLCHRPKAGSAPHVRLSLSMSY